jgi:hypothetical protein
LATWRPQKSAQGLALGAKDTPLSSTALAGGDGPMEGCAHDRIEH